MKKYCLLQLKRVLRYIPWGMCVVLLLFGCMSLIYNAMVEAKEAENDLKDNNITDQAKDIINNAYKGRLPNND